MVTLNRWMRRGCGVWAVAASGLLLAQTASAGPLTNTVHRANITGMTAVATAATNGEVELDRNSRDGGHVTFTNGVGATYQRGSDRRIGLRKVGKLPEGSDVVIQVWDHRRRRLHRGAQHVLQTSNPRRLSVRASRMDTLPEGRVQLQVLTRVEGKVVARAKVNLVVLPEAPAPVAPTLTFQGTNRRVQGDGSSLRLNLKGALPAKGDVLVIAWDHERRRVVRDFELRLTESPWVIPAASLDRLPQGRVQLQALARSRNRVLDRQTHELRVVAPITMPEVAFAEAASTFVLGSSQGITASASADLPVGGDVLVAAWSHDDRTMVKNFAFTLKAGEWEVPAGKLNTLPEGRYTLQLLPRLNRRVMGKVRHELTVRLPMPTLTVGTVPATVAPGGLTPPTLALSGKLPLGGVVTFAVVDLATDLVVEGTRQALGKAPYTINPAALKALDAGRYRLEVSTYLNDQLAKRVSREVQIAAPVAGVPDVAAPPVVAFVQAPDAVTFGSARSFALKLSGDWTAQDDAVVQAWSHADKKLVSGFAFEVDLENPRVPADRLSLLKPGSYQIQVLARQSGDVTKVSRHELEVEGTDTVTVPVTPVDPLTPVGPTPLTPVGPAVPADPMPDVDPTPTLPKVDPTPDPAPAPVPGLEEPVDEDTSVPPKSGFELAFASNAPSLFEVGSDTHLTLDVKGSLPEGADVLMVAWSNTDRTMSSEFPHVLAAEPWMVTSVKLSELPAGPNQIQALVRHNNQVIDRVTHAITIVRDDAVAEPEEPVVEEPVVGETPDPVDSGDGWSAMQASADTRVIYVSAARGDDGNDGRSTGSPVKTLGRAYSLLRDGKPDWMLLRRGETFKLSEADRPFISWNKSGPDRDRKMTVGAYGSMSERRPIIHTNGGGFLRVAHGQMVEHVIFRDLVITANHRNPKSRDFKGNSVREDGINWSTPTHDVVFEGMLVEWFQNNFVFQNRQNNPMPMTDITLRRNVIRYSYNTRGHSQGVFANHGLRNFTLEENVLDHNGYNPAVSGARRSGFNHNVYIKELKGVRFIGNVSMRSSNYGLKLRSDGASRMTDVVVEGNLFLDCTDGVYANTDGVGTPGQNLINVTVRRNVFTRMGRNDTNKALGRGVVLNCVQNGVVESNVFIDNDDANNAPAMRAGSHNRGVAARGNTVVRWLHVDGARTLVDGFSPATGNVENPAETRVIDAKRTMPRFWREVARVNSLEQWAALADGQRRGAWREAMTAKGAGSWLRSGAELRPFD